MLYGFSMFVRQKHSNSRLAKARSDPKEREEAGVEFD